MFCWGFIYVIICYLISGGSINFEIEEYGPKFKGVYAQNEDVEGNNENNLISDDGGDSCEVGHGVHTNAVPSSTNINLKERKNVGKWEKRMGTAGKLQRSLDRLIDGMDQSSNTSVTGSKPKNPFGYDKCLSMLNEVPTLVKGSHLYFLAVRILANKENRVAFFHFMNTNPDMTFDWLSTFS